MKIMGLDISTKTGWAIIENGRLQEHGLIPTPDFMDAIMEDYRLLKRAEHQATELASLVQSHNPDVIVIEQTNAGKFRTAQNLS